jgi:hypothetical protein
MKNFQPSLLPGETKKEMTMADHAEAWWKEQGNEIPKKGTKEWNEMFLKWHTYAFQEISERLDKEPKE